MATTTLQFGLAKCSVTISYVLYRTIKVDSILYQKFALWTYSPFRHEMSLLYFSWNILLRVLTYVCRHCNIKYFILINIFSFFLSFSAIPLARGILPKHNKAEWQNPGTCNSDTWRVSETKVSEHNSTSYWQEATVRSLRFPAWPRTLLQCII